MINKPSQLHIIYAKTRQFSKYNEMNDGIKRLCWVNKSRFCCFTIIGLLSYEISEVSVTASWTDTKLALKR